MKKENSTKVLFCRIGWMEKYCGQIDGDCIQGGGSYVEENGTGHEICNFAPDEHGFLYGYVQPTSETIKLKRLDESADNISISGVTVVWVATHRTNAESEGMKIVGWYRNATVFSKFQQLKPVPAIQKENNLSRYIIKAPEDQAVLLPIDARVRTVPRAQEQKGFFGQSNIWYADDKDENVQSFVKDVLRYINEYDKKLSGSQKKQRTHIQDQAKKVKVEQVAIETVATHFQQLGYEVHSVEKDNCGWDLEANVGKTRLRIEVKGLSGNNFSIGLTPNEYKAFKQKAQDYRLAVVTNALTQPRLFVCRFSLENNSWIAETSEGDHLILDIETHTSAIVSCSF